MADYKTLLADNPSDELLKTEMFADYKKSFENLTKIKNLKKPNNFFSKKPKAEQEAELNRRFTEYLREIEKDKIYFFVLALENKQKVLVVKCPSDNKEQKQFLGFDWSYAKGDEGIKYVNQSSVAAEIEDVETKELVQKISGLHNINTPLYNPNNRNDPSKINHYIQESFLGNELAVTESLQPFIAYHNLADMLDFSRVNFNKQINSSTNKKASLSTKWQTVNLGTIADVKIGGTPSRESADYFNGDNLWVSISEMKGQIITDTKEKISDAGVKKSNVKLIPRGTTLLSFKLSIGKTAIAGKDLYTNEAIAGLIPKDKNIVTNEYLYQIFSAKQIDLESTGSKMFGKSLNSDYLKNDVKIPLPPKEIQQKIVDECAAIDNQAQKAAAEIEKAKTEIKSIINNQLLFGKTKKLADLLDINKFTKDPTQKPDKE